MRRTTISAIVVVALAASIGAACAKHPQGGGTALGPAADGGAAEAGSLPFTADSPGVYVAKVKNILVGLQPSSDELQAVTSDPTQLGNLVDQWMAMPQYQQKMLRFFELAFQQTQIGVTDFANQILYGPAVDFNNATQPLMVQSQQEAFARTALNVAQSGQPFNQLMSTQSYMLTTALKVFYAFTDVYGLDDKTVPNPVDAFHNANPTLQISITAKQMIPASESVDPKSPNYMHWYDPAVAMWGCDPAVYGSYSNNLYAFITGRVPGIGSAPGPTGPCKGPSVTSATPQLTEADFSDWTMTEIAQPQNGEPTTPFYDVASIRSATKLVLNRPFVGYFTTPAFFANWQSNASNTMRVTMNQAFIVATGAQVDGTDTTVPTSTPGLDTTHAGQAQCYTCHRLLDPSRSILAASYTWSYGAPQSDSTYASQPGLFAFEGVQKPVASVADLGAALASHPLVAPGWAQKLCFYVNSQPCDTDDPEFARLANLFQTSSFSWNALVKALVTSPITTHTTSTLTATTVGETVAITRRDHLCAGWSARLGLQDVCGLDPAVTPVLSSGALNIVSGFPSDAYARGSTAPVVPNQPSLFFRAGSENVCEGLAALLVDPTAPPSGARTWSSSGCTAASCPPIADFVSIIAGLPSNDPRAGGLASLLQQHFAAALQQQVTAKVPAALASTQALQSTFVAACMAPSALSIGL